MIGAPGGLRASFRRTQRSPRRPYVAILALLVLTFPQEVAGQATGGPVAPWPAPAADGPVSVYVVTVGPGEKIWERFGHNALWIREPTRGLDRAYDWGVFDFHQEGFIRRLLQGRMLYSMQSSSGSALVSAYLRDGRPVWIQEVHLTGEQVERLREFLVWNDRPENRDYLYDYFRDNCSTRVRDALDRALEGQLRRELEPVATESTYRSHSLGLLSADPVAAAALRLALGNPADRPLSAWEESFIPMRLQSWLRTVTISSDDGRLVSLIASERRLYSSESIGVTPRLPAPGAIWLGIGVLIGGTMMLLAYLGRRFPAAVAGLATLSALWGLAAGAAGSLIFALWAFTDHSATYLNENVLQVSPLALGLVLLSPAAVSGCRWTRDAALFSAVLAALSVAGAALQLVPGLDQANGEVIALVLPVHLAAAVAWYTVIPSIRAGRSLPRCRCAAEAASS